MYTIKTYVFLLHTVA